MTTAPFSPKLLKAGLVLIDPESAKVRRIISLQYNSDTLTRKFQTQETGGDGGGNRVEPSRFKGPAIETYSLDAEIDATDQLEFPSQNPNTGEFGIQPQLALLESLVHPTAAQLRSVDNQASSGTLEIAPMLAPLVVQSGNPDTVSKLGRRGQVARGVTGQRSRDFHSAALVLFVWGKSRIVPVKVTDFSITEEAFDPALNPVRAKVSLGLRVLSVDDLGLSSKGGSLFMTYLQGKETLARKVPPVTFSTLGIGGIS
jgi:hypothetical protein